VNPSEATPDKNFVLLGVVSRPHGIRGELKVRPFTEHPENLRLYRRLYLAAEGDLTKVEFTNEQVRTNGNTVILKLKECTDRSRAEQLAGMGIWLPASELPPLAEGEFYLHSLVGKRARTQAGQFLGTVTALLAGGGQDILVIRDGEEEYLVPMAPEFVVAIDEAEITLDLPPGLLDINR
jgi:16S rRNA processing protein RimM